MASKAKADDDTPEEDEKEEGAEGEGSSAAEGEEGEGGGKLNAKKVLLFIVLPIFLLIGIGGGLYFSGVLDGLLGKGGEEVAEHAEAGDHAEAKDKKKKGEHGKGGEAAGPGAFFLQIPNMLVNLNNSDGGQPRYLRLSVQLELDSQMDMDAVQAVMPRVVDQFQTYLRELRIKDLRGSAGLYRLQIELLSRVNAAAYPVEVKDVLFQEILIQ